MLLFEKKVYIADETAFETEYAMLGILVLFTHD